MHPRQFFRSGLIFLAMCGAAVAQSKSIVLRGQATAYACKTVDHGEIRLKADRDGSNEIRLRLSDGDRLETQSALTGRRSCTWSGPNGKINMVAAPNCFTGLPWFFPQIALAGEHSKLLTAEDFGRKSDATGSYHLLKHKVSLSADPKQKIVNDRVERWSASELRLDPETNLPKETLHKFFVHSLID